MNGTCCAMPVSSPRAGRDTGWVVVGGHRRAAATDGALMALVRPLKPGDAQRSQNDSDRPESSDGTGASRYKTVS